jgi:nitrogenase molybdenum-iron protein alpha/beta subunit
MDRREPEHTANVAEIVRLLTSLGLEDPVVWTSGRRVAELHEAASCDFLIALPYGRAAAHALAERTGAQVLEAELPIGLEGTASWLRAVGEFVNRQKEAQEVIRKNLAEVVPRIAPMVPRVFARKRVAMVAEPALADGLCAYLQELGMEVVGPLYRCRDATAVGKQGERTSMNIRSFDPSVHTVTELVRTAPHLDLMMGSSREHEVVVRRNVPFVELGFPSFHYRPLVDDPYVGFAGALHFAHRISMKLVETSYLRSVMPPTRRVE